MFWPNLVWPFCSLRCLWVSAQSSWVWPVGAKASPVWPQTNTEECHGLALPGLPFALPPVLPRGRCGIVKEFSTFPYQACSQTRIPHVPWGSGPAWHGLPSVLAFACTSGSCSLIPPDFSQRQLPLVSSWLLSSEFRGLPWLGLSLPRLSMYTSACSGPTGEFTSPSEDLLEDPVLLHPDECYYLA